MSGGAGYRVSIPGGVRRMIQNIKEIAGNHTDEEVYAMLKDCAMDPNETAQRLIHQDTFHEVKRKRDKKKDSNKDPVDSKWKTGVQGRGGRIGRGGLSSRFATNDSSRRNVTVGKENGVNDVIDKGNLSDSKIVQDGDLKPTMERSVTALINGPTTIGSLNSSHVCTLKDSAVGSTIPVNEFFSINTDVDTKSHSIPGILNQVVDQPPSSVQRLSLTGVNVSASDPIVVPSFDTHASASVIAFNREIVNRGLATEGNAVKAVSPDIAHSDMLSPSSKSSELRYATAHGKVPGKSHGSEANKFMDVTQEPFSSSSGSRPPSNYNNRPQKLSGSLKALGPNMEWKPKPTHANSAQGSETLSTSGISSVSADDKDQTLLPNTDLSEDLSLKLQKRLRDLHFSDTKHVIIPNHLQVPESERSGFCFGSFDSSFGLDYFINVHSSEKVSTPKSEASHEIEESVEEFSSSICNVRPNEPESTNLGHPHQPSGTSERLQSPGVEIPSQVSQVQEYDQTKSKDASSLEELPHTLVQTTPIYSTLGLVPQMLASQFASFEVTDNHNHDVSSRNRILMSQHFDPLTSYYTQLYRPPVEGDDRFAPFLLSGAATKYNGNMPILPSHSGQAPQEGANALVLPSSGPTSIATHSAGVLQNSIPAPQQQLPLFRHPTGVHIQHFPPNFHLPYSQYITPYVVPTVHPLLGNMPFPQQPPACNIFPPPVAASSASPKFAISQYKPAPNSGNSTHVGVLTGYSPYSTNASVYDPNSSVTSGISTRNEDFSSSQFKENNGYMTAHQTEGSAVWVPAAGREVPALQASSIYNLPPQGQHLPFAYPQAGPGAFAGVYHPTQTVARASVHPLLQPSQAVVGQQPQRAQMNWSNAY